MLRAKIFVERKTMKKLTFSKAYAEIHAMRFMQSNLYLNTFCKSFNTESIFHDLVATNLNFSYDFQFDFGFSDLFFVINILSTLWTIKKKQYEYVKTHTHTHTENMKLYE